MNTPKVTIKEKYETVNTFLEGEYVMAHLDPSTDGVDLPVHLMSGKNVTLKLSRLFRGGMDLLEDRIEASLLFGSSYYACIIPLSALWGVTSAKGESVIWPDCAPTEVLEQISKPAAAPVAKKEKTKSRVKKPVKGSHLRRIKYC